MLDTRLLLRRYRAALAFGLSIAVHAGLLAVLHARPPQRTAPSAPLEFEVVSLPLRAAPAESEPTPAPRRPPPVRVGARRGRPAKAQRIALVPPLPALVEPRESSPMALAPTGDVVVAAPDGVGAGMGVGGGEGGDATFSSGTTAAAAVREERPVLDHEYAIPYPRQAAADGVEGTVILRVQIDESGGVSSAIVMTGVGHGLDEAALEAIRHFHFTPAKENGRPHAAEITYRYHFVLR